MISHRPPPAIVATYVLGNLFAWTYWWFTPPWLAWPIVAAFAVVTGTDIVMRQRHGADFDERDRTWKSGS